MSRKTVVPQELSIVLAAKNNNPILINHDFLRYSGIIEKNWSLLRSPTYKPEFSQLIFQNQISLTAQPERVTFLELITNKNRDEIKIPEIADRYTQILSQADYLAFGLNFRGYVSYENSAEEAYQYLCNTLLSTGKWQNFRQAPVRASVNYVYTLEQCQLNLSVNEATLQFPEQASLPAILFTGNFNYDFKEILEENRPQNLKKILSNWQKDLDTFLELINEYFLDVPTVTNVDPSKVLSLTA